MVKKQHLRYDSGLSNFFFFLKKTEYKKKKMVWNT